MVDTRGKDLKRRVIEEMTVDYADSLEENFELAKEFIRITNDGKIDIIIKDKLSGKEQILAYLIGKLYSRIADFTETEMVGNKELIDELGIPSGSVLPYLKELRDENRIKRITKGQKSYHTISTHLVEKALKYIEYKVTNR